MSTARLGALITALAILIPGCKEDQKAEEKACEDVCVGTLAGSGAAGTSDGAVAEATFDLPKGLAVGPDGAVYVADAANNRIRVIRDDSVETLAGGERGFHDGPTAGAQFAGPIGIAVASDGTIYVADQGNHRIRAIANGTVTTVAGSGEQGFADGPAAQAKFIRPSGLALDQSSNKLYIADFGNHRIRVLDGGQVSTVVGTGDTGLALGQATDAQLNSPHDVAVDDAGVLYIADTGNHRVLKSVAGQVSLIAGATEEKGSKKVAVAGHVDGSTDKAVLNAPVGVVASGGNTYWVEWIDHRVRRAADGQVVTFAGAFKADKPDERGNAGHKDGHPVEALFSSPFDIITVDGQLLVADAGNNRIRSITVR